MGLILCDNLRATNPLYISGLGLRVYTKEELCYVIYNYPLLTLDGFVDDNLLDFAKEDLKISFPSVQLDKEDILFTILNSCDYYSSHELDQYRVKVNESKKLPKYEYLCNKADLLFELKEYRKAINVYSESLEEGTYYKSDEAFNFRVCKSIGNCHANLLELDKAFESYKNALLIKEDKDIFKRIYFLAKFEDTLGNKEKYMAFLDDRVDYSWDEEYEKVLVNSQESEGITELRKELNQDLIKRRKAINNILNTWKQRYRNMLH